MLKNNNDEDNSNDLHLADHDYRHLNLPKHENVSIKEVISQLQQSSSQQASEDQASLYPFHINLAEADTANAAPAEDTPPADQAEAQQAAEDAVVEDEEPLAEDPGVMLLPDTINEVVRMESTQEGQQIKLPVDDDGSQELYRIHHTNEGGVDDQPRDLGIPPVDYPLPKTYTTLVDPEEVLRSARRQGGELNQTRTDPDPDCCSSIVEIKITSKLLYLGDYNCGCQGGDELTLGVAAFSSNYGWDSGSGCGCDCGPYNPPAPPTPNYIIVFNSCDGQQWLDITICNIDVGYGQTQLSSYSSYDSCGCGGYESSYQLDGCCTTYRIDIPAEFGLDCDCPIVSIQTDQVYISSIWDLYYGDTHLIDCHGNCYEFTGPSSARFATLEYDSSVSTSFSIEPCECYGYVDIGLVNQDCEGGTSSGSYYFDQGYNFNFAFISGGGSDVESILEFTFYNSAQSGSSEYISIELPAGMNCLCPIEELIFNQNAFHNYVNSVSDGSSALTATKVLSFFSENGFFEDCHDQGYSLVNNDGSYSLQAGDVSRTELNVSFSCDLVDRFYNWTNNVAYGSFDPFQFFTDNVQFSQVSFNNTSFIEVNYLGIGSDLGNGYYNTYEQTLRISLPEGFCIDDFNEMVIDPKMLYEAYQDSCYQYGYDLEYALYSLLDNYGLHVVNTKTGAEYEVNWSSCSYSYELAPASCEEAIVGCTDCTETPIYVSFTDGSCCACYPSDSIDYFKASYFQSLFNLEYVNCNGASFIEFTYYYNNSDESCQYNSFPVCEETIRISVPETLCGYGCDDGSGSISYDISGILPNNDDYGSLISSLLIKEGYFSYDFINSFFDPNFSDSYGNIDYNIPSTWGQEFLAYLMDTHSQFTTSNGIRYELVNNGSEYVLDLAFDPQVLHTTTGMSGIYETTFLIVDYGDNCSDGGAFLLGLGDQDGILGNELYEGYKLFLPDNYNCNDVQIDLCSLNVNADGFSFNVTDTYGDIFEFKYGNDSGQWTICPEQAAAPVILDLTGQGIELTDAANGVQYDMNNDGVKDQTAWIGSGNGILVYDADQNHTVTNASEFVLTDHVPGAKTDLEALRLGFDSNHDNVFDQKDAAWDLFGIWQDANKDAIVDNGEYHTLAQLGIVSIGLIGEGEDQMVNGNVIHGLASFTWADGSTGVVADVSLRYQDVVQDSNSVVTDPSVSNPTVAEQEHQAVVAQNDPVVQSTLDQMAHQAAVATA